MARYANLGDVVLDVDSFGPRGIRETCLPGASADRVGDAFGALDWLAQQPFIDPNRVGVLGFSQGATIAAYVVSSTAVIEGYHRRFAAAIAYYPACSPSLANVLAPTLVLVGEKDDWSPAATCRDMGVRHGSDPIPEQVVILPGASHGFDVAALANHPLEQYGHHLEYSQTADDTAFNKVMAFLAEYLSK